MPSASYGTRSVPTTLELNSQTTGGRPLHTLVRGITMRDSWPDLRARATGLVCHAAMVLAVASSLSAQVYRRRRSPIAGRRFGGRRSRTDTRGTTALLRQCCRLPGNVSSGLLPMPSPIKARTSGSAGMSRCQRNVALNRRSWPRRNRRPQVSQASFVLS